MKLYALLLTIVVLSSLFFPLTAATADSSTRTPIRHVINIFFENHTFDNIFGIYPEKGGSTSPQITRPLNLLSNASLLKLLNPVPSGSFSTQDPLEGYLPYHEDWNHGLMNGFRNGSGPQSLYYLTAAQVSPLWDLAEEYAIADNYFSPQIGESAPNTLYYLAGFSPVMNDYGPPPYIPFNETVFGELSHFGISWGVYVSGNEKKFDMSQYIEGIREYYGNIGSWQSFLTSLSSGSLPQVSYIFSQDANGYDMGAPSNILKGELFLLYIVDAVERSSYWNSTAIFITWDDPGGYYDQVPPPILNGVQLGFRLPLIVVSPYAKENYVSDTLMTHSSIISFIDYNWDIPALNPFVAELPVPLDLFDFSAPYPSGNVARPPLSFTSFPLPQNVEFNLTAAQLNFNYSSHFPMEPQYNFSSLPYQERGESNQTLLNLGFSLFVHRDISITPFYLSPLFILALVLVNMAILAVLWRRKDGRK
ncbi:MAG: alkaline phosphatase family protein [Thermoplasmata archaeon]